VPGYHSECQPEIVGTERGLGHFNIISCLFGMYSKWYLENSEKLPYYLPLGRPAMEG